MERMVNLILLTGLCFLSLCSSQYQFIYFQNPLTWTEAQTYCREKCVDLATPHDMYELNDILQIVEGKYDDALWFGLVKGEKRRWHWSLTGKQFYKEGESAHLSWGPNQTYHCATYKEGQLHTLPCHIRLPSICFGVTEKGEDEHILINKTLMSWTEALDFCRTDYTDLTSVRNYKEHSIIRQLADGQQVWVGHFRDNWEWSDQTASSLRYWPPDYNVWSEGVATCGALLRAESGRWGGRICSDKNPFICNCTVPGTKETLIKVRISPQDSTLDLNNPAVQDRILEQMMLKLKEFGGEKLRWKKMPNGKVFIKELP